jgi:hypothetical protein
VTEPNRSQRVRESLADARLVEISPEEFPDRIREVKQVAIGHLGKLLETDAGLREPRSVAQSLGTLSWLEATLRTDAQTKKVSPSNPATHPQVHDEKEH